MSNEIRESRLYNLLTDEVKRLYLSLPEYWNANNLNHILLRVESGDLKSVDTEYFTCGVVDKLEHNIYELNFIKIESQGVFKIVKIFSNGVVTYFNGFKNIRHNINLNDYIIGVSLHIVEEKNHNALSVIKQSMKNNISYYFDASLATFIINIIALPVAIYSMQVYDRVMPRSGFETLHVLTLGVFIGIIIDFVARLARSNFIDRSGLIIDQTISSYFFKKLMTSRLESRPKSVGTLASQIRGYDQVRSLLSSSSLMLIADLPFSLLYFIFMIIIGGYIVLPSLIFFILSIALAFILTGFIKRDIDSIQLLSNNKNGIIVDSIDAAESIKSNNGMKQVMSNWSDVSGKLSACEFRLKNTTNLSSLLFNLCQQSAYILTIFIGVYLVSGSNVTLGTVVACTILSSRVNGPLIVSLPNLMIQWENSKVALKALDNIMKLPSEKVSGLSPSFAGENASAISVQNVSFNYPDVKEGVDSVSALIPSGSKIAIIGPSGAGKSTLLRLLSGIYSPSHGSIMLNMIDYSQLDFDFIRSKIAFLPQDYRLIKGTLRDNVTMGLDGVTEDRIISVASKTGLIKIINAHPKGLDRPIAEGGSGLSGGQKMLVGLTRLLLLEPETIILDEPTAHLDQESEKTILNLLFNANSHVKTVVMVTHKLGLLKLFDRLIVMTNGRIVMDGEVNHVLNSLKTRELKVLSKE